MMKLWVLAVCVRGQGFHKQNAAGWIELMSPSDPLWNFWYLVTWHLCTPRAPPLLENTSHCPRPTTRASPWIDLSYEYPKKHRNSTADLVEDHSALTLLLVCSLNASHPRACLTSQHLYIAEKEATARQGTSRDPVAKQWLTGPDSGGEPGLSIAKLCWPCLLNSEHQQVYKWCAGIVLRRTVLLLPCRLRNT